MLGSLGTGHAEREPAVVLGLERERVVGDALVDVQQDVLAPPEPGDPPVRDEKTFASSITDSSPINSQPKFVLSELIQL